jgi:hypothetical protein
MVEKYQESLQKSIKSLQIADHMAYVTYPIVKDKRLLLKILDKIYESLIGMINSILQYDYLWKRVQLYKDPKSNFQVFKEKSGPRCGISSMEISEIIEILAIIEKHKKSPLEFARKDKIVIMSDNLRTSVIDIERVKTYLILTKKTLEKIKLGVKKRE